MTDKRKWYAYRGEWTGRDGNIYGTTFWGRDWEEAQDQMWLAGGGNIVGAVIGPGIPVNFGWVSKLRKWLRRQFR